MQEGPWELGVRQTLCLGPEVTLNLCWGLVTQPAGPVICGGDDGLGNSACCWGGFQWTWYKA